MLPIIFYLNKTDFTNFNWDKKIYTVCITLDSIHLEVCNKPSKIAIDLWTLLLVKTMLASGRMTANKTC